MLRMNASACINASPETTWNILADIENIYLWSESVLSSKCKGTQKSGIGAERVCQIGKNLVITERWIDWIDGISYTYEGFNLPLVKFAMNTWSVKAEKGKTLLSSKSEVVFKGGIFGIFLEPLMWVISKKMASDSLSAFKYLVENGKPYDGEHSNLPRVSAFC